MRMESEKIKDLSEFELTISESTFSIDDLVNELGVSENVAAEVRDSDLVMIPMLGFRDRPEPMFPNLSEEVFAYLGQHKPDSLTIGVCIDDDEYKEVILHSELIRLATFVGSLVVLPILTGLISNYIWSKHDKSENPQVEFKMELTDQRQIIEYRGPAEKLDSVLKEAIKAIKKQK
jgi:hypothetical protein